MNSDVSLIQLAEQIATAAHEGQFRRGGKFHSPVGETPHRPGKFGPSQPGGVKIEFPVVNGVENLSHRLSLFLESILQNSIFHLG